VGPRAGLDTVEKRNIPSPCRGYFSYYFDTRVILQQERSKSILIVGILKQNQ